MRILFVTDEFPWPPDGGYRMRVANMLAALGTVGAVDLFAASDTRRPEDRVVPEDAAVGRRALVDRPVLRRTTRSLLHWLGSGQPRALAWRRWEDLSSDFSAFVRGQTYDVAWYSRSEVFAVFGSLAGGAPAIVDTVDIESSKVAHQLAARAVGDRLELAAERIDVRRWRRLEARVAAEAAGVVVCSRLDRQRLVPADEAIGDKVTVVPNGYDRADASCSVRPARPLGPGPATAVFVGFQGYPPNADASRWLAQEIWPAVRARVPGAELRIVGRGGPELGLGGPGVTFTGPVPDIEAELDRAHLAVIPLRFGGGTRIKLLEAFAYGIPTLATTVAAEGVEGRDGQHLLVADETAGLVDGCVRLFTDEQTRGRLSREAQELWAREYRWAPVRTRVASLVTDVVATHRLKTSTPRRVEPAPPGGRRTVEP